MIDHHTAQVPNVDITLITLSNDQCRAVLTDAGARLLELHVPDADGNLADVVLGRATLEETVTDPNYFGATAGRYANRIRAGKFPLDGVLQQVTCNEGANHLHGGARGFDRHLWSTQLGADGNSVTFWRISPDGEEGFPGTLTTRVTYRLEGRALAIEIEATTDQTTVANIVNHAYFNLGGHDSGPVLEHLLQIHGSHYIPVDDELLPTGEVRAVEGTAFDFRTPTPIGKNLHQVDHAGAGRTTTDAAGYDHNWVLDGTGMREIATLTDPKSRRRLTVSTNQPGVQVYVGGYLDGVTAKAPADQYAAFGGLTFETQTFPDAVNHSHFPQATLNPGETYLNRIRYDFSTV
ncbi:aldose epimerase family protein [Rhodococcus koreensis]